ncbi:response regulator transcription factor [Spongiibacter marinus]|uniref:helix-turn-helix transcriptional regulator n=1 Tax=Spongiibacter marinus TaxID=354246 RepID=UPI003C773A7B
MLKGMLATTYIVDRLNNLYALAAELPQHKYEEEFCRQVSEDFSLAYCQWWSCDSDDARKRSLLGEYSDSPASKTVVCELSSASHGCHRLVFGLMGKSFEMADEAWHALAQGMVAAADNAQRFVGSRMVSAPEDTGVAWLNNDGKLVRFCNAFKAHMLAQLPSWGGSSLPFSLPSPDVEGFVWQGLYIRVLHLNEGIRIAAHTDRRATNVLTEREMDVVRCIVDGCSFKEVGRRLGISPSTASSHLYKAYDKLKLRGRAALVQWYSRGETGAA